MDFVELAEAIAKNLSPRSSSHGLDHVKRVLRIALEIAKRVNDEVDEAVLRVSALLHDIARGLPGDHAEVSAEIAYLVLIEHGAPEEFAKKVKEAILCHSYKRVFVEGKGCNSLEGAILSDADKIDACGAVGIARTFTYGGETGRSIASSVNHLEEKIVKLHRCAMTSYGKKVLEKLSARVNLFLEWIREELGQGAKPSSPFQC